VLRPLPNGRDLFRRGLTPIGLFLWEFVGPGSLSALASTGLDFVVIDMEHAGFSWRDLSGLLSGARATTLSALVRVPELARSSIGRALDLGADGVIAPRVSSREDAARLVRYARFTPEGERNVAFGAPHDGYGAASLPLNELAMAANAHTCCVALVETREGVENIDEIARTPGLDAIWLGFADLSQSLGAVGQYANPAFLAAEERVLSACREAGMPIGVLAGGVAAAARQCSRGYEAIALGTDVGVLQAALSGMIRQLRLGVQDSHGGVES